MSVRKTPSRLGSTLSVATAVVAVGLVATDGGQRLAIGVAVLAAVALAVGLWWRDQPLLTILFVPAGVALLAVSVAIGFLQSTSPGGAAEVIPGLLGLGVLVAALAPVRAKRTRLLVGAGTGLVFLSVVVSGAVVGSSVTELLAAGVATVLAWDLAEQAVNLGEQVGSAAQTRRVEAVHGVATLGVGVAAVVLATLVNGAGVTDVPLFGLAMLLAAAVTLSLVLYN